MNHTFTTANGTELPLLNLRGNDYLEVKYRLVWFREEHPAWSIETEFVNMTEKSALARAVIRDEAGRIIATSHKMEHFSSFPDFMEKAETGSIGRALALIGYGTQFCADELNEGDRIVDAPVAPRSSYASSGSSTPEVVRATSAGLTTSKKSGDPGDYVIRFGKKYMGKKVRDVSQQEIESYIEWLESNAEKKNQRPTNEVILLKAAVDRYFHPEKYESAAVEETAGADESESQVS